MVYGATLLVLLISHRGTDEQKSIIHMQNIYILAYSLVCFTALATIISCSKDAEVKPLDIPKSVTIEVDEDHNLNVNKEWTSSNEFVAKVDGSGKITGNHVGECTIQCSEGSCRVTVTPNYTLYREPLCDTSLTKEYVMSLYGEPRSISENGKTVTYETGQSSAPYIMYTFVNDKLDGAAVVVSKSYESSLKKHLSNRYVYVQYDEGFYQYANAYKWEDVTLVVMYSSLNSSYYLVMYQPQ